MKKAQFIILFFMTIPYDGLSQLDSLKSVLASSDADTTKIDLLFQMANLSENRDTSLTYYKRGVELATPDLPYYQGLGLKKMADKYYGDHLMDSALAYWQKAKLAYRRSIADEPEREVEPLIGEIDYRMAVPHYYSGEYSKALNQLRSALVLLEKHDYTRWTINCYVLLGIIHFAQGEMDLAEEHLTNGIVKALETKQTKSLAILYNNLASVYLQREAYEKARTQYHESLKFISPDDELSFAQTNMNIGLVHLRMGEYKQAKKYLLENRSFFEETSHLRSKITWRNILGELYLATEDWDNVIALSIQTLKELEQMPLAMAKQSTLNQLSLGYEGLDDHQQALKYFKAHVALKDSLFSEEKTKEIERLESQLEFDQKEREIGALTQENLQQEVTLTEERNMRNVILFSGGVLLLMIAVAWMIYKRQQDKRRHMLALKKIEIEQRMLRSQMNPHFIFNALNSIQSFVTTNKTYEAEMIMSKFSMLVRKILENSTQKMISVEEEIETLRLYLELEKSRFDERFEFNISEDADSTLSIPPMLLQPFVENAIIHGMKGKKGKGMISVRFIEEEHHLRCEVEDDGVGRSTKPMTKEHKSLATTLTNERIVFFNEASESSQYNLTIEDLKDDQEMAAGTRVVLKIPLLV